MSQETLLATRCFRRFQLLTNQAANRQTRLLGEPLKPAQQLV